jgi:hypothetical protein
MSNAAAAKVFWAYGSQMPLRTETVRDAARQVEVQGIASTTWEQLRVNGQVLVARICEAIDGADLVVAEISELNSNVLFEAGYAIARNKHVLFAVDDTDSDADRRWKQLSLLSSLGIVLYSGQTQPLVEAVLAYTSEGRDDPRPIETLLVGGKSREADAVFAPALPIKFQAAIGLEKFLERQSYAKVLGAGDDLGLAPLDFYVKEIYRSSAGLFHLLRAGRLRQEEHNARASLLAGVAHGFDLPVLMVAEVGFKSPVDYRDMLWKYNTAAALQTKVDDWLANIPKSAGSNKRLGRLSLNIELPLRSFGQYVAEYEREELTEYFVETSEFRSILAGDSTVFVGRKGTGKTATMSQSVNELKKDRRNLVVSIKPSAYELSGLVDLVKSLEGDSHSEYLLLSLWTYLLYTEIGLRTVSYAGERPAKTGTDANLLLLVQELDDLQIDAADDLSVRLERAVTLLSAGNRRSGESVQDFVSRSLKLHRLNKLRELVVSTLKDFKRVAVLIDNLDKTWERGSDYAVMSRFILALLTAVGRLEKDFARAPGASANLRFTLTVFLRTDIFDIVTKAAREPDKIGALEIRWGDAELLVRVLEERYAANRTSKTKTYDMWDDLFDPEVRGLKTRDYFLWRTLPRPRDFVFFANAALTTAINRKHDRISAADIVHAESAYSQFAVEALLVESEAERFDLEDALYGFAGTSATINELELRALLLSDPQAPAIEAWLVRSGFLGVEVRPGEFKHVEGDTAAKRQLTIAKRFAVNSDKSLRFRVHPAFRAFLEIRDDDLHDDDVVDATLTSDAS